MSFWTSLLKRLFSHGLMPLADAVQEGAFGSAREAIARGANQQELNDSLIPAAHRGVEWIALLVQHGANVNYRNARFRNGTPLHTAAANGYVEIAEYLIAHGADLAARDADGNTPLERATLNPGSVARGTGFPSYPGDSEKPVRKRAVAALLRNHSGQPQPVQSSSIDPRVRDQLGDIIAGLVFKAKNIYFRGKSRDTIFAAVESKLDWKFMDGVPTDKQAEVRREIREMIVNAYEQRR